jgi:hypothetical protein
VLALWLGDND